MKQIKQFLLARKTVLTLILLILAAVVAGYIFPQKFTATEEQFQKWHEAYPFWSQWSGRLGLDHVFTTPWFAALLLIFLVTLTLSTVDQSRFSYRRTFGRGTAPDSEGTRIAASREDIISIIRDAGYGLAYHDESSLKFIRHRWGYWGNALLHAGMAVVIFSSLLIVLTEKRGLIHIVEGDTFLPGGPWLLEETGILGGRFILPDAVRLEKSNIEFWETDEVKYQTTVFSFMGSDGKETRHTVGINLNVNNRGLRIYQGRSFGEAFYVSLTDSAGKEFNRVFNLDHPVKRDKASYGNFMLEGIPYMLKTKYYADAEKRTIDSKDPLLVMRLVQIDQSLGGVTGSGEGGRFKMDIVEKEKVLGEVSLKTGEKKPFGPYAAELVHVAKWTSLIFTRSIGMAGVFAGFFIIIIGGTLTYFMPPREIHAVREGDGFNLTFKSMKFRNLYEDEFKKIIGTFNERKNR
jgi:hypothetical protein